MKRQLSCVVAAAAALAIWGESARLEKVVHAAGSPPAVFQASGPSDASIKGMVDAFRLALGNTNNGNAVGPLSSGHREINWDGQASTATSVVATPFDGFLVNRGARFTTPGTGFVQAPVAGIGTTFANNTYATTFQAFSPVRLFSPIASRITTTLFFIPGGGELPATTKAFGAVFSDVDQANRTTMTFFGVNGETLATRTVPASPGSSTMSFFGLIFTDSIVASVTIATGTNAPGQNDTVDRDIVMMDDFLYGEPKLIQIQN